MLENMTSKELKEMAKELKVKNWWNLKKTELIAQITATQNESEDADDKNIEEPVDDASESVQNESDDAEEVTNDEVIVEESNDESESAQEAPEKKPSNRKVDLIEYNGKTQSLSAWAKELGMPGQTLYARLRISNWPVEKAFTTPSRRKNKDEEEA